MYLKINHWISLCVLLISLNGGAFGQDNLSPAFKKSLFTADILFEEGNYLRAFVIYDSLWDLRPTDQYLQFRTGACSVFKSTGRTKAFEILKELKDNKAFPEVLFYMARAKHFEYQFEEAIKLYDEYLVTTKASGTQRIKTLEYIENCKNGIELMKRKMALSLSILTPPSNASNSQYSPVISTDGKHLYYTNRGPESSGELMDDKNKKRDFGSYYEDIFVAENAEGNDQMKFDEGRSIGPIINSPIRHEAPMSLSYDQKMMFIYLSGEKESEDIYVSYKVSDTAWTAPKKLAGGVNTPHYEGHAFLAKDGKTLFYSSDKPGGYGGRDIYKATMKEDSTFTNFENLGPKINTSFNEDCPYIYKNGSMYFASEAHGSMGGFDIFYIKYDSAANEWQEPINLGYPINTTDDDRFYYITDDGKWGYFSSARASGENLHDIYRIRPGTFERLNSMVLLVGTVFIDEVPSSALVKIMDSQTGDVLATLVSDTNTGEFIFSLLPGKKYKISLLADGFDPKVEYVDVPPMTEGVLRIEHRFDFFSKTFLALHGDKSQIGLQSEIDAGLDFDSQNGKGFTYEGLDYLEIDPNRDELTDAELKAGFRFRVQVGAYRNPGQFQYDFLRDIGEVEIKGYKDGITRYLMAPQFTKRSEAEKLRMECVMAGEWDAWITVRR